MNSVQSYIDQNESRYRDELFALLRIPSISTDSARKDDVRSAALFLKDQFASMKPTRLELYETPGHPIVYAEFIVGKDKPTVLVYGHYDVQPPDPLNLWKTPPFEPTIVDGKVYARGSSDDKGQAYTHVKAIEAYVRTGTPLPANIKFILEGEEEIGSPNLVPFVEAHKDMLRCDMVLISDTAMFAKDTPSLTYGLRGLAYMEVEVTGPNRDLHSGVYGGAIDNPVNVLCRMIAELKDADGKILIDGFYDDVRPLTEKEREAYRALPFDEQAYKKELGVNALFGEKGYSTLERASARPTVDVNGIWGGYTGEGAKTVLPGKANAKISMRLVPNQEPKKIAKLFEDHFKKNAPNTVTVTVHEHHGGYPAITDLEFSGIKAAARAFEKVYHKKPLFAREGGSIPIVAQFRRILGADSILMGFGLNTDALHSPNEHFHLDDYQRGIKVSAQFFEELNP